MLKYLLLYEQMCVFHSCLFCEKLQVSLLTVIYAEVQSHPTMQSPSFHLIKSFKLAKLGV